MHWMPWALDFALPKAGKSMPAKMAMMAITTKSSISVKPDRRPDLCDRVDEDGDGFMDVTGRGWIAGRRMDVRGGKRKHGVMAGRILLRIG